MLFRRRRHLQFLKARPRHKGTYKMTLLITVFAAAISTIFWYNGKTDRKLGTLALMYWGASLMWLVDSVVEYIELGAEFFEQAPKDMINDAYLGFSVVALGIVIWLVVLLIKDPEGKVKALFAK